MKILLVSMEYDYGQPSRGRSYDYFNVLDNLKLTHEIELFDYMQELSSAGRHAMNQHLIKKVRDTGFDVVIFSLYTDQIDASTVDEVRKESKTLCLFYDDTWRHDFVRYWAPHFDFFTSSDPECINKYRRAGLPHVIHFPFGANERLYKPMGLAKRHDVSFVGGWHPAREWLIRRLRKKGIQVAVAGHGWPEGVISHDEMIRMFNESRVNLNLSNSRCWDLRMLCAAPINGVRQLRSAKAAEQIKARHFEINACGAFQLSYYVDGLDRAYAPGREIGIYLDPDDLIDKVRYYLDDVDLRESIAAAGLSRTLAEHTFSMRFERVFGEMGLVQSSAAYV